MAFCGKINARLTPFGSYNEDLRMLRCTGKNGEKQCEADPFDALIDIAANINFLEAAA